MPRKIKIVGKRGWSDCEDCGSYTYEDFDVFVEDKLLLQHSGDSHLGGGEWNTWEDALNEILPVLNYSLEIDIENA